MNPNLQVSEWIIEELIRLGSTQFVISPGSRSTPLTAAAARNPRATTIVHIDERGAAFFALGHARASGKPAVLICTSGTAVANYFPAVVEASMDNIPLIVLSADRPPELIGVGANQAIFQENIYGVYPRLSLNLPPPEKTRSADQILSLVDEIYDAATGARPGPVQLNCQFREPLSGAGGVDFPCDAPESWSKSKSRFTPGNVFTRPDPSKQLDVLRSHLKANQRGLIIIGRSVDPISQMAILKLSLKLNWPVLPDVQSTLRFHKHPHIINHFDLLLLKTRMSSSLPDMVLHFGGAFTSKRLLNYVNHPGIYYISTKETPEPIDPNQQVNLTIQSSAQSILDSVHLSDNAPQSDWLTHWQSAEQEIQQLIALQMDSQSTISEPEISYWLSKSMLTGHTLMLANSMPIRDMEMFGLAGSWAGRVFANRGASGIDGLLATAAGFQSGCQSPLTLLIGDLAFFHDLNSLGLIKNSSHPVIIVLINNKGGGIFNFLPIQAETDIFEPFFGTPHGLSFEKAAALFSLDYFQPRELSEFKNIYSQAQTSVNSTLIEVSTDRSENYSIHQRLFELIRDS